jgi:DNA polymerase-3 subunit chi
MSKISFYQVMNGEVIKFSCQLLEKCFQKNIKTFVQVVDDIAATAIDRTLWTFAQKSFIPHAMDTDPMPDKQPIYISSSDKCPINAKGLMLIGIDRLDVKDFDRVMVMLDGTLPEELKRAEALMASFKNLGHEVEYYLQNSKGTWSVRK